MNHVTVLHMPDDITIEILSYLPAKSLVRFKSVSKDWFSTIESPRFVSKHYRCSNNNGARILGVRGQHPAHYISYSLNNVSHDHVYSHHDPGNDFTWMVELFGPVDDIFCIYSAYSGKVALWNPAINQLKHLPPNSSPGYRDGGSSQLAFGLNPVTNCYKVVWFQFECLSRNNRLWIYDLGGDDSSWRSKFSSYITGCKPYYHCREDICLQARYTKGAYYWLVTETFGFYRATLLALDMATEVFRNVDIPRYYDSGTSFHLHMFPADESIALISICGNRNIDMWGMTEEGNWIMRSRLGISSLERLDMYTLLLVGLWGEDEVLMARELTDEVELRLYKLDHVDCKEKMWRRMIRNVVRFSSPRVFIYKESMAAIRTGTPSSVRSSGHAGGTTALT